MPVIEQLPDFYRPEHAEMWDYRPNILHLRAQAREWSQRWQLEEQGRSIGLVIIDAQKDFCLPEGSLFVAGRSRRGAVDDCARLAQFIYRNLARLTNITATLDTHQNCQIFSDSFWHDNSGFPPPPFTTITFDDLRQGRYRLTPAAHRCVPSHIRDQSSSGDRTGCEPHLWAERQTCHYLEQLELAGRNPLTIWPYHCLLGGGGHALTGIIEEALLFHSAARCVQTRIEIKGEQPWSEHYSVFGPEVQSWWDDSPPVGKNTGLLHHLYQSEVLIFAGQASSHCLLWSLDDFICELSQHDSTATSKIYVLRDCTSPVVIWGSDDKPVVDFTAASESALERWAGLGINIVTSDVDMKEWPGLEWLE